MANLLRGSPVGVIPDSYGMSFSKYGFFNLKIVPMSRAPRPNAIAIMMKIKTGKYSDGKYVPGISAYCYTEKQSLLSSKKNDKYFFVNGIALSICVIIQI